MMNVLYASASPVKRRIISRCYVDLSIFKDQIYKAPLAYNEWLKEWKPIRKDLVHCDFTGGRFKSPWYSESEKTMAMFLRWKLFRRLDRISFDPDPRKTFLETIKTIPVDFSRLSITKLPHFTWLGHAVCYFQTEGLYFITDPTFSDRASPFDFMGPERYVSPPIHAKDLKIDVILLSHTHYDHLDLPTAKVIGNRALWIVPVGVNDFLRQHAGITNCVELNWWQDYSVVAPSGKSIKIVFTPTKHWTARSIWDRNTVLWGSFALLSENVKFFFTGDTAYCPKLFKTIGDAYGPFDLSAIGIGSYKPRWYMKGVHVNPAEAVMIHKDIRSSRSIGIHWGTFPLADEDYLEPPLELARARAEAGVSMETFFTMAHGETVFLGEVSANDYATTRPEMMRAYVRHIEKHGNSALAED